MKLDELIKKTTNSASLSRLVEFIKYDRPFVLEGSRGSHVAVAAVAAGRVLPRVNVFVMDNRDNAAYLYNDLYVLNNQQNVYFFPTAYKRSIEYNQPDPSGQVQRTAVMNAVGHSGGESLYICTYPEALSETIATRGNFDSKAIKIKKGDLIEIAALVEQLVNLGFVQVDFVGEPGQFSVRGGIVDVFSYVDNQPFRITLFDIEVESLKRFDISTQRSMQECEEVEIVPDLSDLKGNEQRVSLLDFVDGGCVVWVEDADYLIRRVGEVRVKYLAAALNRGVEQENAEKSVISKSGLAERLSQKSTILLNESLKEIRTDNRVKFNTASQPVFNKNFELLTDTLAGAADAGYENVIVTDNKAQIERLENIFAQSSDRKVVVDNLSCSLHSGYIDHELKINLFTDHQIFDRHHKYSLHKEVKRSESITISELNALKVGDYVVHIDHGVGRFGGLVRTNENGKMVESIKLVYRDNDVLLVNVHALHRISKYKDKDSEPPKIHKLGSGAWQKLKQTTKTKVKDIAKELIALYAKRKASAGFSFSPDTYLQYDLEASFMYEDTPDQQKATAEVKADMESSAPMDRLVCGDVGFGKTEVAMRAAFKAAADGKQVAVLVPTTILCLQHYRSFSKRFREFPVRVEQISRTRTASQIRGILADLKAGKIDILIGTHRLLNKDVEFRDLGLLIIDEEQKFGVASKEKLRHIKANVDTLTLTATPIPRTLQFSLMGSRDLSIINTPPPNRQPIETEVHLFDEELIKDAISQELARGGQVYFLHNRVESIMGVSGMIRRLLPEARVAVGHGKMKAEELEKLIMDFIYGEYDVLVATTIIEAGIDIPNANTIIIDNGHMFGLSDLHQLRGRVGRSNRKAYCYILTPPENLLSDDARRRLRAIEEFSDLGAGFNLAMQDLDIRGAGNILGGEQSGFITDIGFEAYQKILNEAIAELHIEMAIDEPQSEKNVSVENIRYVSDCQVTTDREALIPDSYIGSTREKIALYKQLDSMQSEKEIAEFVEMLTDRFGALPTQVEELLNILRLRWLAVESGFDKVLMKNGIMILYFVENQRSNYYKSDRFKHILQQVTSHPERYTFKQFNNRLQVSVKRVADAKAGVEAVKFIM